MTRPYNFQIKGVRFLEQRDGRALLGDDQGTGKTLQTIAWLAIRPELRPALVVCPATMKWNWQLELRKHAGIDSDVAESTTPRQLHSGVWIINYDILRAWLPHFTGKQQPKVLVLDECQKVKERRTQRTKASDALARMAPHVIGLSGTPITNRPVEFWPILHMIDPARFNSFTDYAFRFCDPKRGWRGRGWDYSGASNLDELHNIVSEVMIRRMKTDVLKELPPKTRTTVPLEIDNWPEYARATNEFIQWMAEKCGTAAAKRAKRAEAVVKLGALKRLAAEGKIKQISQWAGDFLETTGQKLVLFTVHRSIVQKLKDVFPDAVLVDGSVVGRDRQHAVEAFQHDRHRRVFIGSKAAWEGVTLTASSTVAFTELGWTRAEHNQAEDRVLRIGQKSDRVDAYYFVAKDTVEEYAMELIEQKGAIVNQILDGGREDPTLKIQVAVIEEIVRKGRLK